MFGMIKMLPVLLIAGGAAYGYHTLILKEKNNRINQQQMEIASRRRIVLWRRTRHSTLASLRGTTSLRLQEQDQDI